MNFKIPQYSKTSLIFIFFFTFLSISYSSYVTYRDRDVVPIFKIQETAIKNFISSISQDMNASAWGFDTHRDDFRHSWAYFGGHIDLFDRKQVCPTNTENKLNYILDQYKNREVQVNYLQSLNSRFFCIDKDIFIYILLISIPETKTCQIVFSAQWDSELNCQGFIKRYE